MTNALTGLSWLFEQRPTRFLFCDWMEHLGIFLVFFPFTARSSIPSISMSNLVSMLYDTSVDEVARLREVRRLSSNGPPSKACVATISLGLVGGVEVKSLINTLEHGKEMINQFLPSRV